MKIEIEIDTEQASWSDPMPGNNPLQGTVLIDGKPAVGGSEIAVEHSGSELFLLCDVTMVKAAPQDHR